MKTSLYATALAVSLSNAANAQAVTTQEEVGGSTGDAVYSVRVVGADGVEYNCRPELEQRDGVPTRLCRRHGGSVTGNSMQGSLSTGGLIGGLLAVVALAATSGTD
ncbi:hypothetical protein [Thalassococcus lentus]|uniref:Uncharacterized protein n=1 Tax=Thalassococcus lentus TaxID=1210524 RepID=A0ABT4XR86_9RHOB|nr:hypothetical protein [Thalassococcus lentus]MDA7424412.1 hypothetical protein [Thalassococcus lentus]